MKTLTWLLLRIRRRHLRYRAVTPSVDVMQKYDRKTGKWVNINKPEGGKVIKL